MLKYMALALIVTSPAAFATTPIQQAANETYTNAMRNQQIFAQENLQQDVQKSYRNSQRFHADAQAIADSATKYLSSEQAKNDQAWLIENQSKLMKKEEYREALKTGAELCQNAQKHIQINCDVE